MVPAVPLILFSLWSNMLSPCDASPQTSITQKINSERSYFASISDIKRPQTDLSVNKRRVPVRPQGSRPSSAASFNTNTIRLFKFEYVFTDQEHDELINAMLKMYHQIFAVMLVGIEIEQQAIAFRIGAFTLNMYAVVEALSQSIVLAVLRRLVQLIMIRSGFALGEGVVVVGAGVRVLFAAGIRLQGFEDLNEVVVQPLIRLIG